MLKTFGMLHYDALCINVLLP